MLDLVQMKNMRAHCDSFFLIECMHIVEVKETRMEDFIHNTGPSLQGKTNDVYLAFEQQCHSL